MVGNRFWHNSNHKYEGDNHWTPPDFQDQYTLSTVNLVKLFKDSELGKPVNLEGKQNKIERGNILKGK